MSWPAIISSVATTVVTALVLAWMLRTGNRPPAVRGDAVELGPSTGVRVVLAIGAVLMLGAAGLMVYMVVSGEADAELRRVAWFGIPLFLALGIPSLLEARVRLWMDSEGIRGRTAYRGHRQVLWANLKSVKFSTSGSWLVLRDRAGEAIRVSRMHKGHTYVFDVLQAKVPEKVWKDALRVYAQRFATRP